MSDGDNRIPTWPGPWIPRYAVGAAVVVAAYVAAFVVTLRSPNTPTSQVIEFAMYVGLMALSILGLIKARGLRAFAYETKYALSALNLGQLGYARDVFWRLSERTRVRRFSSITRHNLGWTLMMQGELEHAIAVLLDNDERNARALEAERMRTTSAVDLAFNHALLGNVDEAERWMMAAKTREPDGFRPSYPAMKALAQAAIDCRAGRPGDAARTLDELWSGKALRSVDILRPLAVVRGFAHASAGSACVGEPTIENVKPQYADEYRFLGVAWPEMAAFLAAHQLDSVPISPELAGA